MIRSRAASKSAAVTTVLPRAAAIAASLARSAPEKPGVTLAATSRSTSGARCCLPRTCTARIVARSLTFGSGMVTCRSKRPGRRKAGPSVSGRLVAASTTIPMAGSKPPISVSSWFSVCSRSSLATAPAPARRCPIVSTSSMKMIAPARLRASANRSRTGPRRHRRTARQTRPRHREERHGRLSRLGPGDLHATRPNLVEQLLAGLRRDHHGVAGPVRQCPPLVAPVCAMVTVLTLRADTSDRNCE